MTGLQDPGCHTNSIPEDPQLSLGDMKINNDSSGNKPADFIFKIFTRSARNMRAPALNNRDYIIYFRTFNLITASRNTKKQAVLFWEGSDFSKSLLLFLGLSTLSPWYILMHVHDRVLSFFFLQFVILFFSVLDFRLG